MGLPNLMNFTSNKKRNLPSTGFDRMFNDLFGALEPFALAGAFSESGNFVPRINI